MKKHTKYGHDTIKRVEKEIGGETSQSFSRFAREIGNTGFPGKLIDTRNLIALAGEKL